MSKKPNFENLLKILRKQKPERPTLFEYFMSERFYERLAKGEAAVKNDGLDGQRVAIKAFANAGYDYATIFGSDFHFPQNPKNSVNSLSLNDNPIITDWDSYEAYDWPDPGKCDYSRLEILAPDLPEGMKIIAGDNSGILEAVVGLLGYDNLCILLYDEPNLVRAVVDRIGEELLKFYERCLSFYIVGALIFRSRLGL